MEYNLKITFGGKSYFAEMDGNSDQIFTKENLLNLRNSAIGLMMKNQKVTELQILKINNGGQPVWGIYSKKPFLLESNICKLKFNPTSLCVRFLAFSRTKQVRYFTPFC